MPRWLWALSILALGLAPAPAAGQPYSLEVIREFRGLARIAPAPRPAPSVVERDAAAVAEQVEQRVRDDRLLRQVVGGLPARPDLGSDVRGGVQSRRLLEGLGRR
jgi:hypothetical protein